MCSHTVLVAFHMLFALALCVIALDLCYAPSEGVFHDCVLSGPIIKMRVGLLISAIALLAAGEEECVSTMTSARIKEALREQHVTIADIELKHAPQSKQELDAALKIFEKYGVLLIRGLQKTHAPAIEKASAEAFARSVRLLEAGHITPVQNDDNLVGWITPEQTLFIPAPEGHTRTKQAMVLALDYYSDASALAVATDPVTLDVLEVLLGSPNIETFGKGQCFYKEGVPLATTVGGVSKSMMGHNASADISVAAAVAPGGNPKYLHQDSAYFMFAHKGAVATFSYVVPTSGELDNGPLHVVPGSHAFGHLPHVDTPSHLGCSGEWSFDDALRIDGDAGDTIFFHIHTLHGSPPNRSPEPRPVMINRYIEASDYQIYFATDARMRERAKEEYEEGVRNGRLPPKERGIMVRGAREWREDGPAWKLDARVNH